MTTPSEGSIPAVVAFVDIGTNSVRLLLVQVNPNQSSRILTDQKEMVRLGQDEFTDQALRPEAIDRCVLVCSKFVDLARHNGAREIIAVATSAAREASNQAELVRRLRREAQLDVRVISGLEEARLTYLGVGSGVHLAGNTALFVDIGGGSTEVIVGTQARHQYLDSLQLGAIRLTTLFLADETGPVSRKKYAEIQWFVRDAAVYAIQEVQQFAIDFAVGSSGTIENLAQIAARMVPREHSRRGDLLEYTRLQEVVQMLCSLPLAERRRVPGINPERADIIIAGAAILDTLMQELRVTEIRISRRGLREGLLVDYLGRTEQGAQEQSMSVRRRSVLQLGRNCDLNEDHAQKVASLALQLFDSTREAGLHKLGDSQRELLEYAAVLHDIGAFVSYYNQHAHTYYLIRNADLLGFDQSEIAVMATTALYHRRSRPREKHREFAALNRQEKRVVHVLSLLLRLAESLDRGHGGAVTGARLRPSGDNLLLELTAVRDCELQVWAAQTHQNAVEAEFGRRMLIQVTIQPNGGGPTRQVEENSC